MDVKFKGSSRLADLTVDSKQRLAEEIIQWAKDEFQLHLKPGILPDIDELKRICRGNMIPVWNYLKKNIKNQKNVQFIKGNLLANGKQTKENQRRDALNSLILKKNNLMSHIKEIQSNIKKIQLEIEHIKNDIKMEEMNSSAAKNALDEINHRILLLSSYHERMRRQINVFKEYMRRIKELNAGLESVKEAERKRMETTIFNAKRNSLEKMSTFIETPAMHEVRKLYEKFLNGLLEANHVNEASACEAGSVNEHLTLQMPKIPKENEDEVKKQLQSIAITPGEFIDWLTYNAKETTRILKEKGEALLHDDNINKTTSTIVSTTLHSNDSNGAVPSIYSLIESLRKEQIDRFIAKEKCLNEVAEVRGQIQQLRRKRDLLYSKYENSEEIIALQNWEIELSCGQAVTGVIEAKIESLNGEMREKEKTKEALKKKYQQIQQLQQQSETKQALIKAVIQQNMNSRKEISLKVKSIHKFVSEKILPFESLLRQQNHQIQGLINREVNLFKSIQLDYIQKSSYGSNYSVRDLPIHEFHANFPSIASVGTKNKEISLSSSGGNFSEGVMSGPFTSLSGLLSAWRYPSQKPIEEFLPYVSRVVQDSEDAKNRSSLASSLFESLKSQLNEKNYVDEDKLKGLLNVHEKQKRTQEEEWIPPLQQTGKQIKEAIHECETVKKLDEEWWEQPAFYHVPWVTLDGMNVKQLLDKYNTLTTENQKREEFRYQ